MSGWGDGEWSFWASPAPVDVGVPMPIVVRGQALLIHGVDCRRSVRALLAATRGLRVGMCSVRGVRWLLGINRRWGKRLSSVVVYLDRTVVVRGNSLWFGGRSTLWSVTYLGGDCVLLLLVFSFVSFPCRGSGLSTPPFVYLVYCSGDPRRSYALHTGVY